MGKSRVMSWIKAKSILKSITTFLFVFFVSLEIFSFILSTANLLPVNDTPSLYRRFMDVKSNVATNWWTEEEIWGAWHHKNSVAHDTKNCFKVNYKSNGVGARDENFSKIEKSKNFVLLGDSFAEGFGVNYEDTAQFIIERNIGHPIHNFGSAGNVGPLQYWLIYERLAKDYPHQGVIIFLLPANDFTDNDYAYWVNTKSNLLPNSDYERYRPYYIRQSTNDYEYFIPGNAIKKNVWGVEGAPTGRLQLFIIDNFWAANVLRSIKKIIFINSLTNEKPYSGYFDASFEQQRAALYFLKKIISSAHSKKIWIVSIPILEDYNRINKGEKLEGLYWRNSLVDLSSSSGGRVNFIDLIEHKPRNLTDVFLSCDGHWSTNGNKWAAEIISPHLK
jgi:hypothetical protein